MTCSRYLCLAFFSLAAISLNANGQGAGNPSPAPFSMGQDYGDGGGLSQQEAHAFAARGDERRQSDRTASDLWAKRLRSLPLAREWLALEWQHLGVPADQATVVASAYQGDQPGRSSLPLKGKSDQEIASMLQGALRAKNYGLADRLLIEYERYRLSPRPAK